MLSGYAEYIDAAVWVGFLFGRVICLASLPRPSIYWVYTVSRNHTFVIEVTCIVDEEVPCVLAHTELFPRACGQSGLWCVSCICICETSLGWNRLTSTCIQCGHIMSLHQQGFCWQRQWDIHLEWVLCLGHTCWCLSVWWLAWLCHNRWGWSWERSSK